MSKIIKSLPFFVVFAVLIISFLFLPMSSIAQEQKNGETVTASWLVKVAPGSSLSGARHIYGDWWEIKQASFSSLILHPNVIQVQPNRLIVLDDPPPVHFEITNIVTDTYPNDPYYPYQWHFPQVQAGAVWTTTQGISVTVAILDTGISHDGMDLDCHSFVSPYNAITDETSLEAVTDDHGHGTHVAGTIAQCTNNGIGVAGMASKTAIMPVKVLNNGIGTEADLAVGLNWAIEHGADVVNLSLGADCENEEDTWPECGVEVVDEIIQKALDAGIPIVAAAGNDGKETLVYPANHPGVIAVSAVNYDMELAYYSNYRDGITLAAPGGDSNDNNQDGHVDGILQETFGYAGWGYYYMIGTSMATPHVTGAIALLQSYMPDASSQLIVDALKLTARDLGEDGCDSYYGYGLIQVGDALAFLRQSQLQSEKIYFPRVTNTYGSTTDPSFSSNNNFNY